MAFFEELGKKISETGSEMVKKTKDTAESMKLSSALSDEEKVLNKAYADLGKAYLNTHPENIDNTLLPLISAVNESIKKIEQYKIDICKLKGYTPCEKCGTMVAQDTIFCTSCGNRMQPEIFVAPNIKTCKKCGKILSDGVRFCNACGTKVEDEPEVTAEPEVIAEPEVTAEPEVAAEPEVVAEPVEVKAPEVPSNNADVCKNCGSVLRGGALFCTSCGTAVEMTDQKPQEVNNGFKVKNICKNCGKELSLEAKFCTGCGTPV